MKNQSKISLTVKPWSRFYHFEEVYDYYGVFDESGVSKRKIKKVKGKQGFPHTDNGFRLRSMATGRTSFKNIVQRVTIEEAPCPLSRGDLGCYFIRIQVKNDIWDYIGKSSELTKGISDRLRDHFIKIAGTFEAYGKDTEQFLLMREEVFSKYNIETDSIDFFESHVKLAFSKVNRRSPKLEEHVSKIEGMSLAFYKERKGYFPFLNKTDETKGLEGLEKLV